MKNLSIIQLLKSGDAAFYEQQYELYREEFMGYALKKGVHPEAAIDIYQDSFIIVFQNAVSGKLDTLSSSLKTYIFGIANNKILEFYRKENKTVNLDEQFHIKEEMIELELKENVLNERQLSMSSAFKKLGDRCKNIISLFYLDGLTIKEIMESENYTSENTVKAQKSRCMKQLKELIKN